MPKSRLTLEQAAEFLGLQPQELRSLAVQELIQASQQGERFFFTQDDLDEWITRKILSFRSLKPADQHRERKILRLPDTSQPFLATLCTPQTIISDLRARSKASVLKALSELAANSEYLYDPDDLYEELVSREEIASTAIENGVAFPHPHHRFETPLFENNFICIAKLLEPIYFGNSPDGGKTDLFFLVCCLDSTLHIQIIARLCQLCQETSLLAEIRAAQSPDEIFAVLQEVDEHPENHPFKQSLD